MLQDIIKTYGEIAVFVLVMLEYACFPVPSEIILPLAGSMAFINNNPLINIILLTTFAGFIGLMICYAIGYYGGYPLIEKIKKKFKATKKGIDSSIESFRKYQNIAVSVGRIVPLCRTYVSFIAGASRQNIFKYMLLSVIGIFVWNSVLVSLGYLFFDKLEVIHAIYQKYQIFSILIITIIVIVCILLIIKRIKKHSQKN